MATHFPRPRPSATGIVAAWLRGSAGGYAGSLDPLPASAYVFEATPPRRRRRWALIASLPLLALTSAASERQASPTVADRIWGGGSVAERLRIAAAIADADPPFAQTYAALRDGPVRRSDAPRGRRRARHRVAGIDHPYLLDVPEGDAPASGFGVRIYLHGGVGRSELPESWWRDPGRVARDDAISLFPASWAESKWWQDSQRQNLRALLDALKRDYDIDENRVHLFGISDGGTGVWYLAFRDPTPWAGLVPMIGHPAVLASPRVAVDGQMHASNLTNRSFLIFNGGTDRLYPSRSVRPYLSLFEDLGVALEFVDRPDDGHTVSWWPEEAARIERYLARATRDPLPATVDWTTDGSDATGRAHWLVIDELRAPTTADHEFPPDERPSSTASNAPVIGFPRPRPTGRVRATVDDNSVRVLARGVRSFRLLLSPEQFDLHRPVRLRVNDQPAYEIAVEPDVRLLLEYAARDLDRTMLFGASIRVDL